MIKIELKNIKKGSFFSFERNTNAKRWMKGERSSDNKRTWVYNLDCAALVDPNKKVYVRDISNVKDSYVQRKKLIIIEAI